MDMIWSGLIRLVDGSTVGSWVRKAVLVAITASGVGAYIPWVTEEFATLVSGAVGIAVTGIWSWIARKMTFTQ
jgi:hypothetical protein